MVAGVASGLAQHLDLDVTAVRFGFVAASLLLLGGIGGPLLYAAAWALVPEDGKANSIVSGTLEAKPWENWGKYNPWSTSTAGPPPGAANS